MLKSNYLHKKNLHSNSMMLLPIQGYFGAVGAFLENVGYTADRSPSPDVEQRQKATSNAAGTSGSSGSPKEQLTNRVTENHIEASTEENVSLWPLGGDEV